MRSHISFTGRERDCYFSFSANEAFRDEPKTEENTVTGILDIFWS